MGRNQTVDLSQFLKKQRPHDRFVNERSHKPPRNTKSFRIGKITKPQGNRKLGRNR